MQARLDQLFIPQCCSPTRTVNCVPSDSDAPLWASASKYWGVLDEPHLESFPHKWPGGVCFGAT
eukprot:1154012-Pelagomonas_calceolata.AAC.1